MTISENYNLNNIVSDIDIIKSKFLLTNQLELLK